ncbi:glgB1 [Symbiodinium pilosum]|uniref:GlgB1 protein n=1 Tax=Symbiodinium pilosum TaxID=2952 RepID=A0A812LZ32_SYMPI|nr:glgB1 [Symbiodinium pilosum]
MPQALCEDIIRKSISIDNVVQIMMTAKAHRADGLKDICMDFIITNEEKIKPTPAFKELIQEPTLMYELLMRFLPQMRWHPNTDNPEDCTNKALYNLDSVECLGRAPSRIKHVAGKAQRHHMALVEQPVEAGLSRKHGIEFEKSSRFSAGKTAMFALFAWFLYILLDPLHCMHSMNVGSVTNCSVIRVLNTLLRYRPHAFLEMPTPAAVGILGEANAEVMDMSVPASPRNDGEAWEAGPAPGPPNRYADKAQGLSLAERLLQLDFSDDEDEGSQPASPEHPEQEADGLDPVAEEDASAAVVVEDCQEFVQEADSDDD